MEDFMLDDPTKGTWMSYLNLYIFMKEAIRERNTHKWDKCQERLKYLTSITKETDIDQHFIQGVTSLKFRAGGIQTYEAKWKAITITTSKSFSYQVFTHSLQKYFTQSNNSTPMFSYFIYTIEHIGSNIHAHIACQFTAKKFPPGKIIKSLRRVFPKGEYDISLKDNNKKCHLMSKNYKQISGYIDYIMNPYLDKKANSGLYDHKVIVSSDTYQLNKVLKDNPHI
jgi:hypothetical protein